MWRLVVRLDALLTCVAAMALSVATPAAAAPGFSARFTELPDAFASGASPVTVAVVVSRTDGGDCLKVRWSIVLRVQGFRLDQMRVDRIEENGSFPVEVRVDGEVARLTDVQLDPGTLCQDRTVTARYEVSFAEAVTNSRVSFAAEAYDASLRLLARETADRAVIGDPVPPQPDPTESAPLEPSPSEPAVVEPSAAVSSGDVGGDPAENRGAGAGTGQALDPAADNRGSGLPLVWFLIGAVLVFFGASLLIRTAWRLRRAPAPELATDGTIVYRSAARGRRSVRF